MSATASEVLKVARLPDNSEPLFELHLDPSLPPEAEFWWRTLGSSAPDVRCTVERGRSGGIRVVLDRRDLPRYAVLAGGFSADIYAEDAAAGAEVEMHMRMGLWAPAWAQGLRGLGGSALRHALYQLLLAWQGERIIVPPAGEFPSSLVDVYLVPERAWYSRKRDAYAIVASALHAIAVRGLSPAEAVAQAHAEADDELIVSHPTPRLVRQSEWAGSWRLGWARPGPEFQWLFGTWLEQAWRDQRLVCGFRVAPATWAEPYPREARAYTRPGASRRQPWTAVARFRVNRWTPGSALPHSALVPLQPPSLRWRTEVEAALYQVLAAWPSGQKALLVQRDTLSHPDPVRRDVLVGLRLAGVSGEEVLSVFETAVRSAQDGATLDELRQWLGRIGSGEARALQVLRSLN